MSMATKPRFPLDQFWGFAASSVVYQSTRILPSDVLWGTMANDFVRSICNSASISRRSSVYGFVLSRLLGRDNAVGASISPDLTLRVVTRCWSSGKSSNCLAFFSSCSESDRDGFDLSESGAFSMVL